MAGPAPKARLTHWPTRGEPTTPAPPRPPHPPARRPRWNGLAARAGRRRGPGVQHRLRSASAPRPGPAYADFADGRGGRDVIIGKDNDNSDNPLIQPTGTAADQSLNNTDIQLGGSGHDVLIGLLGDDVQLGESGDDVLIGGPEGGAGGGPPNSDVQSGGSGTDVSIWAPGDGSDFFHGGSGNRDAQVVGLIDRDPAGTRNVKLNPANGYSQGLPSVDVSGLNAQCTIDKVPAESELGYEFLVRFRNAAGALVVTLRQVEVEQVFCPSTNGHGGRRASSTPTCAGQPAVPQRLPGRGQAAQPAGGPDHPLTPPAAPRGAAGRRANPRAHPNTQPAAGARGRRQAPDRGAHAGAAPRGAGLPAAPRGGRRPRGAMLAASRAGGDEPRATPTAPSAPPDGRARRVFASFGLPTSAPWARAPPSGARPRADAGGARAGVAFRLRSRGAPIPP